MCILNVIFSFSSGITILLKYLEKGHTQMEVDSVHSVIERAQHKRDLQVPADYCKLVEEARKNPHPYRVRYLHYTFFKNYEDRKMYSSIRPGIGSGSSTVFDVRQYRCQTNGTVQFKLRHDDKQYTDLPQRHNGKAFDNDAGPLYDAPIPLTSRKFFDS